MLRRKRLRGGCFAATPTDPYHPRGTLFGQMQKASCVAACCRMLLFDYVPDVGEDLSFSESSLRNALQTTDQGTSASLIEKVMRAYGLTLSYRYRRDLTIAQLQATTAAYPAIAIVKTPDDLGVHALLIDDVNAARVLIRDPLPVCEGSAYALPLPVFLSAWLDPKTGRGKAVIVLE